MKYYVIPLKAINQYISGELSITKNCLINKYDVIKIANKIGLERETPIILSLDSDTTDRLLDENIPIEFSDFDLENPENLDITETTANEAYNNIKKYSKLKILNNLIKNNSKDVTKILKLYSRIVDDAKKLNIKNAEEASLMTAIKKSGVKYAI